MWQAGGHALPGALWLGQGARSMKPQGWGNMQSHEGSPGGWGSAGQGTCHQACKDQGGGTMLDVTLVPWSLPLAVGIG